MADVFWNSF